MTSLRRQLTRRLLLVLAALLGAGLLSITLGAWLELVELFDHALRTQALAVGALTEFEGGRIQFDFSEDFLRDFGGPHPHRYFEIWDEAGVRLARSPSLPADDLPRVAGLGDPRYRNVTLPNGRPGRLISLLARVKPADPRAGPAGGPAVQIAVASDRGDLNETLAGLLGAVAVCGGLLLLAVGWAVPRLLRRGLAPLEQLGEEAARIDANSLAMRFSTAGLPLELNLIAARLNGLLARLEQSFERERRFSADLAHELRTPLAELRSLAECALKWPDAREPGADRDVLAAALQMESLVTRMLALARSERGQLAVRLEPVAVDALAAEAWKPFAARAAGRGLVPAFTLAPGWSLADPVLLRSVLAGLFDNAVDYTPAGGSLLVAGEAAADGGYVLRVANPAGGLEPGDVSRLFDRFWRKEAARSGGEHAGLGLSLGRAAAAAMGWRLTAALDERGWLGFTLASETPAVTAPAKP